MRFLTSCFATLLLVPLAQAQQPPADDIRNLKLKDWQPHSMLVTRTTVVEKPRFPVIDIHNHLGSGKQVLTPERVEKYLTEMNEAGVRTVVNLDGGWGDKLKETIAALDQAHPGRFATFALVNFDGIDAATWSERETKQLEESFKAGAKGLKFYKQFGLRHRYKDGRLVPVDDPKLDPIWELCGKYHKPVVIHIADPAAFFTPLDRFNERWHELNSNPHWLFFGPQFPKRQDLLDQLHRVIGKHPKTTFVNTHFGNNAEDLASVAEKLDKYPNMVVDIDARISELGRQPYTARKFFLKYQDRIMFGTDTPPKREAYRIYYRFLETDDEYFDCAESHHRQGFWNIYGIFLPEEVLEKVYRKNAERILGLGPPATLETKPATPTMTVVATDDFEVTGEGSSPAWNKATWETIPRRRADGLPYQARVKLLYSTTGIYALMEGTDARVSATMKADGLDLWTEDVFEIFLWPDERHSIYFEYEVSPLGHELPLVVPNLAGKYMPWRPWHYDGKRRVQKAVKVQGGSQQSGSTITGWSAEVFIPYELLKPLTNIPPKPGTRWRANFYRIDYDDGRKTSWQWAPVGSSFHEHHKFGTLVFQ